MIERIPAVSYTAEFGPDCGWHFVSPQVERLLGYTVDEWRADPQLWFRSIHPEDRAAVLAAEERTASEGIPFSCEYRLLARDRTEVWVRDDAVVTTTEDGQPVLQGLMLDITEQKRVEQRLVYLADHDELTGLHNRRRFFQELESYLAWNARHGEPGAVLLLDVDQLKTVNDSLGHESGDALLKHIADRLRHRLRETDELARLGGDEFVVLLRAVTPISAAELASDLVDTLTAEPILLAGQSVKPSASVGVALIEPANRLEADALVAKADLSMYELKRPERRSEPEGSRSAAVSPPRLATGAAHAETALVEALSGVQNELSRLEELRSDLRVRYGQMLPNFVANFLGASDDAALRASEHAARAQTLVSR